MMKIEGKKPPNNIGDQTANEHQAKGMT